MVNFGLEPFASYLYHFNLCGSRSTTLNQSISKPTPLRWALLWLWAAGSAIRLMAASTSNTGWLNPHHRIAIWKICTSAIIIIYIAHRPPSPSAFSSREDNQSVACFQSINKLLYEKNINRQLIRKLSFRVYWKLMVSRFFKTKNLFGMLIGSLLEV